MKFTGRWMDAVEINPLPMPAGALSRIGQWVDLARLRIKEPSFRSMRIELARRSLSCDNDLSNMTTLHSFGEHPFKLMKLPVGGNHP